MTESAQAVCTDVAYLPGDVLLFGKESIGLPDAVLRHPAVADRLRVPMLADSRSLDVAGAAAIVLFEAWRGRGCDGAA